MTIVSQALLSTRQISAGIRTSRVDPYLEVKHEDDRHHQSTNIAKRYAIEQIVALEEL